MTKLRVPLVGSFNQRGVEGSDDIAAGIDQIFTNVTFDLVRNPITGKGTIYVEKRPGWGVLSLVEAGSVSTGFLRTDTIGSVVSAFGATNSTIYDSTISVGAITGTALHWGETIINAIGYILIRSSDGTGWYYASNAAAQLSYVGDTHTNTTIDNIASTVGMHSGQAISGTNIVAGTRILSVDSATAITTNTATTGTTAGVTITKTPIAKILDADFLTTGTAQSGWAEMDGYVFYVNEDGYLYHSDLNSIIAWTATNKIAVNMAPDLPLAIGRHKNLILVNGQGSIEPFHNAGNASGSVLSRSEEYFTKVGIQNQRSMAALKDDIYFVASTKDGDISVQRLRNLQATPVSTPQVNRILGTASSTSANIYLSAFELGGYSWVSAIATGTSGSMQLENDDFVLLENGDNILLELDESVATSFDAMLMYNADLNIWCRWDNTLMTFIRGLGAGSLNQIATTSRINTSGKIYLINPSGDDELYRDDGSDFTVTIQTSAFDLNEPRRKFIHRVSWVGDVQTAGTVDLYKSDNDFETWELLGTLDLTQNAPFIAGCGSHRGNRAYKLVKTDNYALRGQALDIEYEVAA